MSGVCREVVGRAAGARCPRGLGRLRQLTLLLLLLPGLLFSGCGRKPDVSERVELVSDYESVGPAATYELRFDRPVVNAREIGVALSNSPLVIQPPLRGAFTWLSQRGGVFTPAEALALDTTYELALAPGLRDAEGQPVQARLHKTLKTPPFSLVGFTPARGSTNAGSDPEIHLRFNARVQAAAANRFIEFRDGRGRRVAAVVRQGTFGERPSSYEFGAGVSWRTWAERFKDLQPDPEPANTGGLLEDLRVSLGDGEGELVMTNAVANFLTVYPQSPLPIGRDWNLVISPGLPAAEGGLRLPTRQRVPIGDVTPFVFVRGVVRNVINELPTITLQFSKPLAESLTNSLSDWLAVKPSPADLTAHLEGKVVVVRGSFTPNTRYTINLRAGLPAEEAFTLGETQQVAVSIPPVAPRLYFPAFSAEQLANGNREFQMLAVNVPKVRLRAKVLDPQTAIFALRGYASYFRSWRDRDSWNEPYRRVDYNLVPGRTVCNEETSFDVPVDVVTNLTFRWDKILGGRKTAVVFLDAEGDEGDEGQTPLGTQALIQLTDLGVLWKSSPSQIQAFVFSHRTGKAIAGAAVKVLSEENEVLQEVATTADGIAWAAARTNAHWLAVQSGEDFHAVALREVNIPLYSFHLPTETSGNEDDSRRVLLFSDRGLYRPDETVQLKAVVRDWGDHGLTIPADLAGTLVGTDARGRKFFETNVSFSAFGSCAAAVPLTSGTRGEHRAVLKLGDRTYEYEFQVQDFQPSAFEIALPARPSYGAAERIEIPLSAHYYFGKPLTRAQVKWSLEAEDTEFQPDAFEGFEFTRSRIEGRFGRGPSARSLTGRSELTAATNCVIAPELPLSATAPQPRAVSLLVEVTDINQQTLSRRVEFIQHSSDFYLGLRQDGEVRVTGKAPKLEMVAVGADGKPWSRPVTAQMELQKIDWQPVRIQGAGRSVRFRNHAVFTKVSEQTVTVSPAPRLAKPGEAIPSTPITGIAALAAGQYLLAASASDDAGHPVVCSLEFSVSADDPTAWDYRNDVQLTLKPDRTEYAPGDTAQILVEAPISGWALVTIERDKILRSFTTLLQGNAPVIQVPIAPGDVPNLFVSVTLVRGSEACPRRVKEPEHRVGYCALAVKDPRNHLTVDVSCSSPDYRPAQEVTVNVGVKDGRGAATGDAEVTLYAVDEGVLSLFDKEAPDPYAFFYGPRPLAVQTSISLPGLVAEDPDELRFSNKGYLGGGGGEMGRLRDNFLACAFWNATLRTDAQGRVAAAFLAPDGLTRYRVVAMAHTRDSHFGGGRAAFEVSKPLVVEPALPRFANVTDRVLARAVVLNQTAQSGDVEVTLELDRHAKGTEPAMTRRVAVPANGSVAVEFPIECLETGAAKWIWKTRFADAPPGGFTDTVQSTLNIGYPSPMLREILLRRVEGASANLLAPASPQLMGGTGTITVQLANTRLIGLSEAVSWLLHYPYGCAEQTCSSLLPWVVLQDESQPWAVLALGTNDPVKAVRSGIARLFSMQTQSGGIAYWLGEKEPMFSASAYSGLVLGLAQRRGTPVPAEDFKRLLDYLGGQLRADNLSSTSGEDLCLAAYALAVAGRAEPAYHEKLFSQRGQLGPEARALLALAISESQGPREMVNELLASTAPAKPPAEHLFHSPARGKAIRLLAAVCADSTLAGVENLVTDLMNEQQVGQWETTQGNAWAVLALGEYGRRIEGTPGPCHGELVSDNATLSFQLAGTNNVFTHTFAFGQGAPQPAIKLVSTQGTVFATTTVAARPALIQQPRQDNGFGLQRTYQLLDDEDQPGEFTQARVGDRVLVTLRLEVRAKARFIALDDALPSNLEAINPVFKSQQSRGSGVSPHADAADGYPLLCDFQEIRADRMLFFANEVAPGSYTLRYLARVRSAGSATAPAAKVEEMYNPGRRGLTATQVLSSFPLR